MKFKHRVLHGLRDAQENFEQLEGLLEYQGNGVPTLQASKGARYWRLDDPTTANHRLYVNTADGANWTGVL